MADYAKVLQKARQLEYEYVRDNPDYFFKNYSWLEDKDTAEIVVPFNPWPAQIEAFNSVHRHKLNIILKARQLGITWLALNYCAWDLISHPGHTVVALSKTESDAQELVRRMTVILNANPALLAGGDITWDSNASEARLKHPGGLISVFRSLPATKGSGRSLTANIVLLDEWAYQEYAAEIWDSAYPTINRPTGGKVIGLSTIKRGTKFEEIWTGDNNFNKIFLSVFIDPRRTREWYAETLKALGEAKTRQEYPRTAEEALANAGGLFFPEFDYDKHTCQPVPIPEGSRIYAVKDYGYDMLAHYKIAVTPAGDVLVFHEIYKPGLMISQAAELIRQADYDGKGLPWHPPRDRLAPPDLFAVSPETGQSQEAKFSSCGLKMSIKVSNNRETGWLMVRELLKDVPRGDGTTSPRLKIFRTCPNLIRCMQQILVDEKHPEDCSDDNHELTHSIDALRYFAIWWVKVPEITREKKVNREVWTEDLLQDYYRADAEGKAYLRGKYGSPP